jgi:hypothetical protein
MLGVESKQDVNPFQHWFFSSLPKGFFGSLSDVRKECGRAVIAAHPFRTIQEVRTIQEAARFLAAPPRMACVPATPAQRAIPRLPAGRAAFSPIVCRGARYRGKSGHSSFAFTFSTRP